MSFTSTFKNLGHAIAVGAKYLETGVLEALKLATKAQNIAPEVELIVGVVAGPQAAAAADLGFHLLGDVATALKALNDDALSVTAEKGLNVQIDLQTLKDIKAMVAVIEKVLAARGTPAPAA